MPPEKFEYKSEQEKKEISRGIIRAYLEAYRAGVWDMELAIEMIEKLATGKVTVIINAA